MAVKSVTINSTTWTPLTTAGQMGSLSIRDIPFYWKKHVIRIAEAISAPETDTQDYVELFPTMNNSQYLTLVPDTIHHIFYARCEADGDSTVIFVDVN